MGVPLFEGLNIFTFYLILVMFGVFGIYETHIFFCYLDSFIYLYQLVSLLYVDLFVDVTDVGLSLAPGGEGEAGGASE